MNALPLPHSGIQAISPYIGGEAKVAGHEAPLRLASNENALGCSPLAREAYLKAAGELHRYPDGSATALRAAIGQTYALNPAQIVCGAGSDELIALLCKAYAQRGDEVLYSQYGFLMYRISALGTGATPVMAKADALDADPAALLAAITPRTKIIFLANPNNPTGTWWGREKLAKFIAAVPPHIVIALDNAYTEYATQADYSDGIEFILHYPNVIILRTFSKIYGLAALRLGWGYGGAAVIDALNRARNPFNVNAIAQAVGIAALQDQEFVQQSIQNNELAKRMFMDQLSSSRDSAGIHIYPSAGNFVLVDFGSADAASQMHTHLQQNGILVRPMVAYGLPQCLRITIGLPEDMQRVANTIIE